MTTPTIDTTQFLAQLVAVAQENLQAQRSMVAMGTISPASATTHKAAKDALAEAHSALSQSSFFTALDALGGQEAIIEQVVEQITGQPMTEETYAERLKWDGGVCPCCQSVELENGHLERRGIHLFARVRCGTCGVEFEERYQIAGYELMPEAITASMPFRS